MPEGEARVTKLQQPAVLGGGEPALTPAVLPAVWH